MHVQVNLYFVNSRNILIVDDDIFNHEAINMILT
jgi:hypothetical protein